jgi:O-succinylbenzoic acid--CoA ligase
LPENHSLAAEFLAKWDSGISEFQLPTSGSTGVPKIISLNRAAMEHSAHITGKFLGVQKTDRIFCCLPVTRIGGLMQLVRSRVWDIPVDVAEPSGNPLLDHSGSHSITSFTSMQLANILENDTSKKALQNFRIVLLGGGEIPLDLEQKTRGMVPRFFHTYGMTETCSHIAMRELNKATLFQVLEGVEIRTNQDECLEIKGLATENKWITTNDLAMIDSKGFTILGRKDNTINSGGIKIQPEEVENAIYTHLLLPANSIMLAGIDDYKLGKKAVLLIDRSKVKAILEDGFNYISEKTKRPKEIHFIDQFAFTETGKLDRNATLTQFLRSCPG